MFTHEVGVWAGLVWWLRLVWGVCCCHGGGWAADVGNVNEYGIRDEGDGGDVWWVE